LQKIKTRLIERKLFRLYTRAVSENRNSHFRRIRESESADDRYDRKIRCDVPLAFDDHVGIRAPRSEQSDRRRDDRHVYECFFEALAGEQTSQHRRCLGAALAAIDVRIGPVADDDVGVVDHALRDVRVKIDCRDHRTLRSDCLTRQFIKRAIGIAVGRRNRRG